MQKKAVACATALLTAVAAHAAPSDVNAQAFYADAMALQKKGMGALFDKRTKPMMAQMKDAGERARAANLAAKAAGRPLYCVPEGAKRGMGAQEAIALIGKIPEAERRSSSLLQVWKRALSQEYPCR